MKKIVLFIAILLMFATQTFATEEMIATDSVVKQSWQFLSENWGWIASVLFLISEAMASSKMKENSIYQFIMKWLKKKAVKVKD